MSRGSCGCMYCVVVFQYGRVSPYSESRLQVVQGSGPRSSSGSAAASIPVEIY